MIVVKHDIMLRYFSALINVTIFFSDQLSGESKKEAYQVWFNEAYQIGNNAKDPFWYYIGILKEIIYVIILNGTDGSNQHSYNQNQQPEGILLKYWFEKLRKTYRKTSAIESFCDKIIDVGLQLY